MRVAAATQIQQAMGHRPSVAEADVALERGLTSGHIGGDFLGELCGGIRISAGYPVAAVSGRELPGLRDSVCARLFIAVHQRSGLLRRPLVYGHAGQLVREAVVVGGPSGGGVGNSLIHRDGRGTLHFAAQRLANRANCGDTKNPVKVFMDARLAQRRLVASVRGNVLCY